MSASKTFKKVETKPIVKKVKTDELEEQKLIGQYVSNLLFESVGKTERHVAFEKKYDLTVLKVPRQTMSTRINLFIAAFKNKYSTTDNPVDDQRRAFVSELSTFVLGTQEPYLKVYSVANSVSYAVGGGMNNTQPISWNELKSASTAADLATIFGQVRLIKGEARYSVGLLATAITADKYIAPFIATIVYENPSSFIATTIESSDGSRIFCPIVIDHTITYPWDWHGQGHPDLNWIITSDTTTVVAYFILASIGTQPAAASLFSGVFTFNSWCQFRQIVQ